MSTNDTPWYLFKRFSSVTTIVYNYGNIVPFTNTPNYIDIHVQICFLINPADCFEHSENK